MKAAVELEWVVGHDVGDDDFHPAARGPAYGMARLVDASDYCGRPARRAGGLGRGRRAVPPRVRAGAARAVRRRGGPGVRRRHLGAGPDGDRGRRRGARLPHVVLTEGRRARRRQRRARAPLALAGRGEPDGGRPVGALRAHRGRRGLRRRDPRAPPGPDGGRRARCDVVPAARAVPLGRARTPCWGLENREAAVRMVTGSPGATASAANVEVKCFDLHANPYLVFAGLIAAGLAGLSSSAVAARPGRRRPCRAAATTSWSRAGSGGCPRTCARPSMPSPPTRWCGTPSGGRCRRRSSPSASRSWSCSTVSPTRPSPPRPRWQR